MLPFSTRLRRYPWSVILVGLCVLAVVGGYAWSRLHERGSLITDPACGKANEAKGGCIISFPVHAVPAVHSEITLSPSGDTLYALDGKAHDHDSAAGSQLVAWKTSDGAELWRRAIDGYVQSLAIAPAGDKLVAWSMDATATIRLLSLPDGKLLGQTPPISFNIGDVAFNTLGAINQSSCNKDFSCVKGFCPSFVTVNGGQLRKKAPVDLGAIGELPPAASLQPLDRPYNIAVGGVGGTGVLTIGALLGMAAHIEGKASMILDMSGLAQKGGAVLSHVRISQNTQDVTCSRIVTGTADLLIAADEVVAIAKETITLCESQRTHGIINTHLIPIADFVRDRDFDFQRRKVNRVLQGALREGSVFLDFTHAAEGLLGDSIATNVMMLGYAYQQGLLPVSAEAIDQAIELNGVSIKMNRLAFALGRLASVDPARLHAMLKDESVAPKTLDQMSLVEIIDHRSALLRDYQNEKLAARYRDLVERVKTAASGAGLSEDLPRTVAINYAKLLAYKDEYEVARLFTDGKFEQSIRDQFEGDFTLNFNLAPPLLGGGKDALGRPRKREFGPGMMKGFRLLAKMRTLRGTPLDIFGYSADRRLERDLIRGYENDVEFLLDKLSPQTIDTAIELLSLPDRIRGYGPVKEKAVTDARKRYDELMRDLVNPPPRVEPQLAAE